MSKLNKKIFWLTWLVAFGALACSNEAVTHQGSMQTVPFQRVQLEDEFWYPRLKTQSEVLVPFAFEKTENAVENLRRTGNFLKGIEDELPFAHRYLSSDLYKVMEGAAYLLMLTEDKMLEEKMDSIIQIIGSAQKEDGYIYVAHTVGIPGRYPAWGGAGMGDRPYSFVLHSHELYNMGHMYEAAVAYFQSTGKREWLNIAEKNARHINKVFFEGDENYNGGIPINQAPGHQEIELGLIKLYRATGDSLYLNMSKRFLDIRGITYTPDGDGVMAPTYSQQHLPVARQKEPVGHAVRAVYMYSAMAEVEALLHADEYLEALDNIWQNIVDTRMHITGGLGAVHGIEGFGPEYDLPNASAYNETCASVGNVFFNFRMFLLTGEAKYLDVAEVSLYNNSLAGVSMEGNCFHYVNPLEFDGETPYNFGNAGRSPWFSTACCPTNIARLIPQVSGMAYTYNDHDIYTGLYMGSSTVIPLNGGDVLIKQITKYPFEGEVRFEISSEKPQRFSLNLRIPTWAGNQFVPGELYSYINHQELPFSIVVNGKPVDVVEKDGFARIHRKWEKNDVVELSLPMAVRYNSCSDSVEVNRNKLAITRGPLVYCAEEVDNNGRIGNYFVDENFSSNVKEARIDEGILKNVIQVAVPSLHLTMEGKEESELKLIPYYAWNNRGQGTMAVWVPRNRPFESDDMSQTQHEKAVMYRIKSSCSDGGETVFEISNKIPKKSTAPVWKSCLSDRNPWVEISCEPEKEIQSVSVYWCDNGENCQVPDDWELEFRSGKEWHPFKIYATDHYSVFRDQFNMVHPAAPLKCDALRINMKPKPESPVGILSLRIDYTDH